MPYELCDWYQIQINPPKTYGTSYLESSLSMPDDIFYGQGAGTCVCVMVWEAGKPHNPFASTFFGYYKTMVL